MQLSLVVGRYSDQASQLAALDSQWRAVELRRDGYENDTARPKKRGY